MSATRWSCAYRDDRGAKRSGAVPSTSPASPPACGMAQVAISTVITVVETSGRHGRWRRGRSSRLRSRIPVWGGRGEVSAALRLGRESAAPRYAADELVGRRFRGRSWHRVAVQLVASGDPGTPFSMSAAQTRSGGALGTTSRRPPGRSAWSACHTCVTQGLSCRT